MTGLDKMTERILKDAKRSAQEIITKAKKDAEKVLSDASSEADREADMILKQAGRRAEEYIQRAESAADMNRKREMLAAKQAIIQEVLQEAYEKVMHLDSDKYFALISRLLEKSVLAQRGKIIFSARDMARMPDDFPDKIRDAAAAAGGSLEMADGKESIDGGFLIIYDAVEVDCTFSEVFISKKEELSDQANRILFE